MTGVVEQAGCPACGGSRIASRGPWSESGYGMMECLDCTLLWADPLRGEPDLYGDAYQTDGAYAAELELAERVKAGKGHRAFGWPYRVLIRSVAGWRGVGRGGVQGRFFEAGPRGRFFEVGCGAGYFVEHMRRQGWHASGCDVSGSAIRAARRLFSLELGHTDFNDRAVEDRSIDLLAAFEVIEHLADPVGFLRTVERKLKPGGCAFVSTPNASSGWPLAWKREKSVLPPYHLTVFSERSLGAAARAAGLEVEAFIQKPVPYRYEFHEQDYSRFRLALEALKAYATGVKGVTLVAVLRSQGG